MDFEGVEFTAVEGDAVIEVRSGGVPGAAHQGDGLPVLHVLSDLHQKLAVVAVAALPAAPMVDHHGVAVPAGIKPGVHGAETGGFYEGALRREDVQSTVEVAARHHQGAVTETAGDFAIEGPRPGFLAEPCGRELRFGTAFAGGFGRQGEFLSDVQAGDVFDVPVGFKQVSMLRTCCRTIQVRVSPFWTV